jgi:hypothetical protein
MSVCEGAKGCSRVTLTQLNHPYTLLNTIVVLMGEYIILIYCALSSHQMLG